jgi:dihydroorotase
MSTTVAGFDATPSLTLVRPDDWHVHLRDGPLMASVVNCDSACIRPGAHHAQSAATGDNNKRGAALSRADSFGVDATARFVPLMTLYLTDNTDAAEIANAKASGIVHAVKYYPAGATTHSDDGVTALDRVYPALAAMEKLGMPLSVHGEATDADIDVFDRERVFVDRSLSRVVRDFPGLAIIVEHISTQEATQFVAEAPANVAATITPQHLLYSRNALFTGGIRPHFFCLPILKRETHRRALIDAAISGNPKFFLGTDSAPHARHTKENACWLRGLLLGARGIGALCRGVRAGRRTGSSGGLCQSFRRRLLSAATSGRNGDADTPTVDRARRIQLRRTYRRAVARR